MATLNLVDRATPQTRLRLVYGIVSSALGGRTGARNAAADIVRSWDADPATFVVSPPTDPTEGGAPGAGVWNLAAAVLGTHEWYTALDVKTNVSVPSVTWGELIRPHRRFGLHLSYNAAEFVHGEIIVPGTLGAGTPAAQLGAATRTAQEQKDRSPAEVWPRWIRNLAVALVVIALVGGATYLYLRFRPRGA